MRRVFLCVFALVIPLRLFSAPEAPHISFPGDQGDPSLSWNELQVFFDRENRFQLNADKLNRDALWSRQAPKEIAGFRSYPVWIRFKLNYSTVRIRNTQNCFILSLQNPSLQYADFFYQYPGSEWVHLRTGSSVRKPENDSLTTWPSVSLPCSTAHSNVLILIRLSTDSTMRAPVQVFTPEDFAEHRKLIFFSHGFLYGSLMLLFLFNLHAWFLYKYRLFLYMFLFTVLYMISYMSLDHLFPALPGMNQPAFLSRYLFITAPVALILLNTIYMFLFQSIKSIRLLLYFLYTLFSFVAFVFLIDYSYGLKAQIAVASLGLAVYPFISFYGLLKKIPLQSYFFGTFIVTGVTTLIFYIPGLLGYSDIFVSLSVIRLINIPAIFMMTLSILSYVTKQRDRIESEMEDKINRQIQLIREQQALAVNANIEKQELLKLVGAEMNEPLHKGKKMIQSENDHERLADGLKTIVENLFTLSEKIIHTGRKQP